MKHARCLCSLLSASLIILLCMSFVAAGEKPYEVGLVIDQPPIVVMKVESDIMAEIVRRIDTACQDFCVTILHPTADGTFVDRNGHPKSLKDFRVLLLFQGDGISKNAPLFTAETIEQLKAFIAVPGKGIVLTGGACALPESLGFGPVDAKRITIDDDIQQSGMVPVQPKARLFSGTTIDRQTVWTSNAAYHVYTAYRSKSPRLICYATTMGAWRLELLGGVTKDPNGTARTSLLVYPWVVSPMYDQAAQEFRSNFETMLTNLIRCVGTPFSSADITPDPFTLPDFAAFRRALNDLIETYREEYPKGNDFLKELATLETRGGSVKTAAQAGQLQKEFTTLQRNALLLSNPEIDFDELLYIRRNPEKNGFPRNHGANAELDPTGYKNEIVRFNFRSLQERRVYKPEHDEYVGELELHYDADRIMFSMPDKSIDFHWRIWEYSLTAADQVSKQNHAKLAPAVIKLVSQHDVDNYDACWLPDDSVVFCSTACFTGVPCVNGVVHVANLYHKEPNGTIRQLTVDQDDDWNPAVMNNGRVMYLRWEYTDLPHCFSRIMFHMNPDGTNQSELYGSGSQWPPSVFYARPIPDHPTRFVGIVSGHHGLNRVGDLVLFDPALGRFETEGVVQRIPGWGKKVSPVQCDLPIGQTWPKFVHPYPITDKYFVVSCQRKAGDPWTLCLVDVFDNIITLKEEKEFALYEPVPIRKTERQPIIPPRINPAQKEANVFIADIYRGEGLRGVPRGTVKSLRIFTYQFGYQGMGCEPFSVGLDGPWDPKMVLGTVDVNDDGSAFFKIPVYTPVAFQPLDAQGKAIQLMRSWITAMPGESISCIGCHEKQNTTGPAIPSGKAARSKPVPIKPFDPERRGFSFERVIQPILDRYCLECHQPDSKAAQAVLSRKGIKDTGSVFVPDFRSGPVRPTQDNKARLNVSALFSPSYYQLRRFVRTPTKESQMAMHKPYEFHADTTRLVQLLQEGHYDVKLDSASWDRLFTWIDLNAPYHGNWGDLRNNDMAAEVLHQYKRRGDMRKLYAGVSDRLDDDPSRRYPPIPVNDKIADDPRNLRFVDLPDAPDTNKAAQAKPVFTEAKIESLELAPGISLELVTVPGTTYRIGRFEITNQQYKVFDPKHDSNIEYGDFLHFSLGEKGHLLSRPSQPVVRVTWNEAIAFCRWLSKKTGRNVTLPTRTQWKHAALAGAKTPFWFGSSDADFTQCENLADLTFSKTNIFNWLGRADAIPPWRPADTSRDDRARVAVPVGSFKANPWKLYDMQGNVSEWTRSESRLGNEVRKIVCGGSWNTRPQCGGADDVRRFPPCFNVFDTGFRIVVE